MTSLTSLSFLFTLAVILLYGIYTVYRAVINSSNSIKDAERIHRFVLVVSGIIIGLAVTSIELFEQPDVWQNRDLYFGLFLSILGIMGIATAKFYLQNMFYKPLEQISEFSVNVGTDFVGARLPVTGVKELKSFAHRWNQQLLNLGHRLSKAEIQLDKLRRNIHRSIDAFSSYSRDMYDLSVHFDSSNQVLDSYTSNASILQSASHTFLDWYEESQDTLDSLLVELRSLTDLGNLISVNAAIESVNLEVENPGFTTIANKLHELAKTLEERHDHLKRYLIDSRNRYSEFNETINQVMKTSESLTSRADEVGGTINVLINSIKNYDREIATEIDDIRLTITNLIEDLPTSF
ncbi:MAG: hypothetical protein INQ03_10105 [Candidatus Heimdallarchaeota archaeon]|nr:hypothetical protein [Candidatus Heimdallarchaeota archaeon]